MAPVLGREETMRARVRNKIGPAIPPPIKKEASIFDYIVRDYPLTEIEKEEILQLVVLVTDPKEHFHFPTWAHKAKMLKIKEEKVQLYRRLPEYKAALIDAARVVAAENSARLVHRVSKLADEEDDHAVSGARLVLETAGAKQAAVQQNITDNRSVHISLESQLRGLIGASVDASFEEVKKP